jgi:hypothetical protein
VILQPEQRESSELEMGFPFFSPYIRNPPVICWPVIIDRQAELNYDFFLH